MCACLVASQLFTTPRTVVHQPPLSMGFSRQEYWSGLPFPPPAAPNFASDYFKWIWSRSVCTLQGILGHCPSLERVAVIDVIRYFISNTGFLCVQTPFHSSRRGHYPVLDVVTLGTSCFSVGKVNRVCPMSIEKFCLCSDLNSLLIFQS